MKVLTQEQIRIAEQQSKYLPAELMQRAASACVNWIEENLPRYNTCYIFCGPGNNGGDGLVMAGMLSEKGYPVKTYLWNSDSYTPLNVQHQERLRNAGMEILPFSSRSDIPIPEDKSMCIDAILGSGLNRVLEGELADCADAINSAGFDTVVSIDSPTGFFTDQPVPPAAIAIRPHYTLTFHCPRPMYFFPEYEHWLGQWQILDIGLNDKGLKSPLHYTILPDVKPILAPRNRFGHKGNFGHALIAGGSFGKTGAAILAIKACLRSGAGLTTAFIPKSSYTALQSALPEAMVQCSGSENHISGRIKTEKYTAIGFGPGTGTDSETATTLKLLLQDSAFPLVIDADGLNILSENKTWLSFLPPLTILTPHPGELARLTAKTESGYERLELARHLSRRFSCIVVVKGAFTAVVSPEGQVFFNSTGNPGMATGGSGDVLTGIITALLARKINPVDAARLGVFLHGLAGDIAASEYGQESLTAGDIADALPKAFRILEKA